MASIDFKKAYDMIPHSWIDGSLQIFGVADNITKVLMHNMKGMENKIVLN